jgi:hypothetical protein
MVYLLIPYVPLSWHHDPMLEEFTYGDSESRARKLKRDLKRGDYVFFHTTIRGQRHILLSEIRRAEKETLKDRQVDTWQGRLDLLFEDENKNLVVVN